MNRKLIGALLIALLVAAQQAAAQQTEPPQQQPKVARPTPPVTFAERIKRYAQRHGATIDAAKSTEDMVVSNYPDSKGGKTTIVIVNDRRKGLVGFYIYNFGSVKNASNREEVYKYLLATNDAITIGSFFIDNEDDIGYKYLISAAQPITQAQFDSAYLTMAAVARERRQQIRDLITRDQGTGIGSQGLSLR
jgi:hypothetical protein